MKHYSRIAVLLAVSFIAGCHKSAQNAENPPTQPAADQSQSAAAPAPAQPSAGTPAQSSATASGSPAPAAAPSGAVTPTPSQPVAPQQAANAPAPAVAPLPEVPAGTVLSIRMNQAINVKHTAAGAPFTGTIVNPILVDGNTVIPSGATAEGMVVRAHKRGRFKGASYLQLTLTGLDVNGQHYRIDTSSLTRTKKGKGKRTFGFIGGGTGLGMLIGGVATGGVGLLVGGLAGAGAGTGLAAFTGNKDITIPAESVVNFKLAAPIHLR
ncbi:MAG TPA: hypothetical protein VHB45_07625 [Alloacidobacterium sp.]|nr:hypothetical protein [Alloacidobacterium sp.]